MGCSYSRFGSDMLPRPHAFTFIAPQEFRPLGNQRSSGAGNKQHQQHHRKRATSENSCERLPERLTIGGAAAAMLTENLGQQAIAPHSHPQASKLWLDRCDATRAAKERAVRRMSE